MSLRVVSERIMSRGFDTSAKRLMERVQATVTKQPGLLSIEQLQDTEDHHKFVVLSTWSSKKHLDDWIKNPLYKEIESQLNDVLDRPAKYRIFKHPTDDVFLL